ncbi:MucBP domain-containing protein [Weissella diestrammenae]|uniref:MucBP domain-containing protein n=1 Tax=Weissella diestrammenae TaxID=1162633 RepID=A0A7G9T5M4_9LACO|nr:MucBP domain-containing protein [Weissella diestrammenae]MCM0582226.1 MucBP domain-containing protein [Weissella diestrammenae]QNN75399.1 MucBP domain-containing protein [Weissella diestrammenae]
MKNKILRVAMLGALLGTIISPLANQVHADSNQNNTTQSTQESNITDEASKPMQRNLGGVTGRWLVINGHNEYFSPTIKIKKDDPSNVEISKIVSQNSGYTNKFVQTILFSDAVVIQALPKIIAPSKTTYTIQYTEDKTTFSQTPPNDVTKIKGIKIEFANMTQADQVEVKNTAKISWDKTHSGVNELGKFYEDDYLNNTVYFDSYRMVTASYINEDGQQLAENKYFYGEVGQSYQTQKLDIPGYELASVVGFESGQFKNDDRTVKYIYKKLPITSTNVTAKYIDTDNNVLAKDVVKTGNVGEKYETDQLTFTGYTLKEVQGNAKGVFDTNNQVVTYVYSKDATITNPTQPVSPLKPGTTITSNSTSPVYNGKQGNTLPSTSATNLMLYSGLVGVLLSILGFSYILLKKI